MQGVDNSFFAEGVCWYNESMKNYPYPPLSSYRSQKLVEVLPEGRVLFFDEIVRYNHRLLKKEKKEVAFYACLYCKDLRKIIWSAKDSSKDALYEIVCRQLEMLYNGGDVLPKETSA